MPTIQDIREQIASLPHRYIFFTRKEIRALPRILTEGEQILALTSGIMDSNTWLAICTPRRLIFLHRGMLLGQRQVQIPLDRIQSIDHEFKILFGSIRVWDGASYFTLRLVLRNSIIPFVNAVQQAVQELRLKGLPKPGQPQLMTTPSPAAPALDMASQLERLASLKDRGILTDQEFQEQKRRILESA